MTDITGRHAAKHTRKGTEIGPKNATVHLSDKVRNRFEDLFEATCSTAHTFDSDVHVSIRMFASIPDINLEDLVRELPKVVLETERWATANGNEKARDALKSALEALGEERSFMLVKNQPSAHRQA